MNKINAKEPRCPACRSTGLVPFEYQREFRPHGKQVTVDLFALRCPACATESTRSAQHTENLRRLKARKADYDGLLLGEEIRALRRRYGITQQTAAKLFGKGKIAFSRYENETSYPDQSTTKLLMLAIEKMDVMRWLAEQAGMELPLWEARCEGEKSAKLRILPKLRRADSSESCWVAPQFRPKPDAEAVRHWTDDATRVPTNIRATNDDQFAAQEHLA